LQKKPVDDRLFVFLFAEVGWLAASYWCFSLNGLGASPGWRAYFLVVSLQDKGLSGFFRGQALRKERPCNFSPRILRWMRVQFGTSPNGRVLPDDHCNITI
jgi:hypothetical protein